VCHLSLYPSDLLSFPDATVHPFQDIVQALLQSHISNVLAALVMVVEFGVSARLQTFSHHNPSLLVAAVICHE
jgi:hypothetical protein